VRSILATVRWMTKSMLSASETEFPSAAPTNGAPPGQKHRRGSAFRNVDSVEPWPRRPP